MIPGAATMRKRDEVACGRRKLRREDEICPGKREHSPIVQSRMPNLAGLYSEDWDELQQEADDWQVPDKWQRISHMVFLGEYLEKHPYCSECMYIKILYSTPRRGM